MALYLPRYNSVFIHIYKTAGTSIRTYLMKLDKNYSELGNGGHSDYSEIQEEVEDKILFSVVRNPYDWIYSLYQYGKNYNTHPFYSFCVTHTFDQFVKWYFDNIEILNTSAVNGKLQTQTEYLSIDGILKVKNILKMENLETDLNKLFRDVFRQNILIRLDTLNSTPYPRITPQNIKSETISIINEKYHNDFINFNYKKI